MKRKQYITLTLVNTSNQIHINTWMICAVADQDEGSKITTMDGSVNYVKENSTEIMRLIDSAQSMTYFNSDL
jgi:hypothetical protein